MIAATCGSGAAITNKPLKLGYESRGGFNACKNNYKVILGNSDLILDEAKNLPDRDDVANPAGFPDFI